MTDISMLGSKMNNDQSGRGQGTSDIATGQVHRFQNQPAPPADHQWRSVNGLISTTTTNSTSYVSGDEAEDLVGSIMHRSHETRGTEIATRSDSGVNAREVHFHFTQTEIRNPSAIALGGQVVLNHPVDKETEEEETPSVPTRLQKLRRETENRFIKWTEGMIMTTAIKTILDKISKGVAWITITGCPGEGKTTAGYMVLKSLHNMGRQVYDVVTPEDYFIAKDSKTSVLMFNDILGSLQFDIDKRWKDVLVNVLAIKEHRIGKCIAEMEKIVIFITRSYVLKEASAYLGRFKELLLDREGFIDLSNAFSNNTNDRMKIWKYHAKRFNVDIDQRTVANVCRMSVNHGFPHCCRLFAALYSHNTKLSMEAFFSKPIEFLNQTIESLMTDQPTRNLLKEMMKHDGSLDLDSLSDDEKRYQYLCVANRLGGTYLSQDTSTITFHHPSVYDSVAFVLCIKDPLFVLENCSLLFLNERVRIEGMQYGMNKIHQKTVTISRKYTSKLLQRLKVEVENGNISDCLSQQAFHDETFASPFVESILQVNKWYKRKSQCKRFRKVIHKLDRTSGESFLYLSTKSQSNKILKLICDSVRLNQEELNEVLFGICEHVSVSSLKLLEERYQLNYNITNNNSETPLLLAAAKGSEEMLKLILQKDVDVRKVNKEGDTPLHVVCRYGVDDDGGIVKMLIDRGAVANRRAPLYPWRPLNIACNKGHKAVVKTLLECGVNVNEASWAGIIPLHDASWMGHVNIVEYLLDKGADINRSNSDYHDGKTPLHDASSRGHLDVVTRLLERGADVNKTSSVTGRAALHYACLVGHVEVTAVLLDRGADVNKAIADGRTALIDACFLGQIDIVTLLLERGACVNKMDSPCQRSLPSVSLSSFSLKVLTYLIKMSCHCGLSSLQIANWLVHPDCVKDGLDIYGSAYNGESPLHCACLQGHLDVVVTLLESGADVNETNQLGASPLYGSCWMGYVDVATVLMDNGADINKSNGDRFNEKTALQGACFKGHLGIVITLLDRGANIHRTNKYGLTSVHIASCMGHVNIVDVLLERGAHVNTSNCLGRTPLHDAHCFSQREVMNILLKRGADMNKRDHKGRRALDGCSCIQHFSKCASRLCAETLL